MPEMTTADPAAGNRTTYLKYTPLIVCIFLFIISIFYYKQIELKKLSNIKEYSQAIDEASTNPKHAALLINQININDLSNNGKQKILIQKAQINSEAGNLTDYLDTLLQIINTPSFPARKRGYAHVNLAKILEMQGDDISVKKYLVKIYPEVDTFSNLEASLYFLSKAEEIDKTPYIDMLRARYSAYKISPQNFTEKDLSTVRNYLESVKIQTNDPKDNFVLEASLEALHNRAITELYIYSLTKIKLSKENSPIEIEKGLLLNPNISANLKVRAIVVYLYAVTLLHETDNNIIFANELLEKNSFGANFINLGSRESSELKRHFTKNDVDEVLAKFPSALFLK